MITFVLWLVASYLAGSIPTAFIVGKLVQKIDIRRYGSGNVGASNVFRVMGKKWGSLVLLTDMLKGYIPAYLIPIFYSFDNPQWFETPRMLGLAFGFAAIAGHNWPVWLRFKGGKGVATSAGVFLAILPKAVLFAGAIWIVTVIAWNYIALGSMVACFSFPFFIFIYYRNIPEFWFLFAASFALAFLSIYMHRANIERIKKGTEHRVFKRRSKT